jgi:anti-sigma B factor antagonist
MPDAQSFPDPASGRTDFLQPFECSCMDGTLDAAWVRVAGALDIATTPRLAHTLREAQARLVVLDLRELSFIDSSGVNVIVDASNRARRLGRQLVLLRGPAEVERIFSLTGHATAVETGDLGPAASPAGSRQRSLVSSSLLRSDGHARGGRRSH